MTTLRIRFSFTDEQRSLHSFRVIIVVRLVLLVITVIIVIVIAVSIDAAPDRTKSRAKLLVLASLAIAHLNRTATTH